MSGKATGKTYLVVGGGGFLGRTIVNMLLERGEKNVRVFDLRGYEDNRVKFFIGDIRKEEDLTPAITGVDTIFNTVSPPHGGKYEVYYGVNVEGTRKLIEVAKKCKVANFVHTSSSSVVFQGKDLRGADEKTPFPEKHIDPYTYTKQLAEIDVLEANGKELLTCALRPSGIFGPGDRQFWPTLIDVAKQGKWKYQLGDGKNLADFTYVDNVAHAHILASDKIKAGSGIEGEVFIITNDEPMPLWDMTKAAYEGLGYGKPYIVIPTFLIWYLSILIDIIARLISPIVAWHPNFTFFRVCNAVCYRHFNIGKAKTVLGYKPLVPMKEGIQRTLKYFKHQQEQTKKAK